MKETRRGTRRWRGDFLLPVSLSLSFSYSGTRLFVLFLFQNITQWSLPPWKSVQAGKWFRPANDPQIGQPMIPTLSDQRTPDWLANDPQIGRPMIPTLSGQRTPDWLANDPQIGQPMIPTLSGQRTPDWLANDPQIGWQRIPKLASQWSLNWPVNDPQIGRPMIPKLVGTWSPKLAGQWSPKLAGQWSPNWLAIDPRTGNDLLTRKEGTAWNLDFIG